MVSNESSDLRFKSANDIHVIGNEGFYADSKTVNITAQGDVKFGVLDPKFVSIIKKNLLLQDWKGLVVGKDK